MLFFNILVIRGLMEQLEEHSFSKKCECPLHNHITNIGFVKNKFYKEYYLLIKNLTNECSKEVEILLFHKHSKLKLVL